MRVFVLGLDGCTWDLLEPWLKAGELPVLERIRREGAWGYMESCLPPVTSPNWKCYSTGRNPGKLGVYWWEIVDYVNGRIMLPRAVDYQGQEIWDYLGRAGLRVVVINMPTTYPPKPVNGVLVAGGPDALDTRYTFPVSLEAELRSRFDYRVHPRGVGVIDADPEQAAERIIPLLGLRFRVAEYLIEREQPDFVHLTIYYINVLQHHFWDGAVVRKAWKSIDRELGELLKKLPGWTVMLMADHGTNQIVTQFNINTWLAQEGYLTLRPDWRRTSLRRLGLTRERAVSVATKIGIKDWLKARLSAEAISFLLTSDGAVGHAGRAGLIDWERSKAVASGQGPVYINPALPAWEREALRRQLQARLSELHDDLGRPVALEVWRGEELYRGPRASAGPDLVVEQADGVHISGCISAGEVFQRPRKWCAENHKRGLFAAVGPGIAPQRLHARVRITDIAPTILHAYGLGVPVEMDGRVLRELFEKDSGPYRAAPDYPGEYAGTTEEKRRDQEEAAVIEERLRALGYLE